MNKRIRNRFLRGMVALVVPVVVGYIADWLVGLPADLPPAYAAIMAPVLSAAGKWLRDMGIKNVPV